MTREPRANHGYLDRLVETPSRLPGHMLIWLAALYLGIVLSAHAVLWISGAVKAGEPETFSVLATGVFVYLVGFVNVLKAVGQSAYVEFEPALGDQQERSYKDELSHIPDRQVIAVFAGGLIVALVAVIADPKGISSSSPAYSAVVLVTTVGILLAFALVLLLIIRQLRLVSRLHQAARIVDVFEPRAINAFSRLTAAAAIGVAIASIPFVISETLSWLSIGLVLLLLAVAVASFIIPLRGMHERLKNEKARLMSECNERVKVTMGRILEAVDSNELAKAERLESSLTGLLALREVVSRLATWPWSPGVLRSFGAATILPIVLWLVIRTLERFV